MDRVHIHTSLSLILLSGLLSVLLSVLVLVLVLLLLLVSLLVLLLFVSVSPIVVSFFFFLKDQLQRKFHT